MRQVGGSHRGLDMWLLQRASAIYMTLFLPVFVMFAVSRGPLDYVAWHGLFEPMAVRLASLLFVAAVLLHAWIGLREIFIDYLHCTRCLMLRLVLYFAFAVLYLACLVWAADIFWSVK